MAKVFSSQTLEKFENAAASIPLAQLDRAFSYAGIRLGKDPGGAAGSRKVQFRRYLASVDQHDPLQLEQLGTALGSLIGEVAPSKEEFLVRAAERDGFAFAEGVFREAVTAPSSFALTRAEELRLIDDRVRRLDLLANEDPAAAATGAVTLIDSVCRTILRSIDEPVPGKTAKLENVVATTLQALEAAPRGNSNVKKRAALQQTVRQLNRVVASLGELRNASASARHARLSVGLASALAGFVAQSYLEREGRR